MSDELRDELQDAHPGAIVEAFGDGWKVLLPTVRQAHDYVMLTVDRTEGGWRITDGGEAASLGTTSDELVRILQCADPDVEQDGVTIKLDVDGDDSLTAAVMRFGYLVSSSAALWSARACLNDATVVDTLPARSSAGEMARETRQRLVSSLGKNAAGVIHLNRTISGRGENARAPLAIAPSVTRGMPRLVAAFVDLEASLQSVSAAKKVASWTFEVSQELRIPKYLVVRGGPEDISHFERFYDRLNVNAISFADQAPLLQDAHVAANGMGLV